MSYTLKHTAEELDHKLDLIDINKNLLPYPYNITFPASLQDVGDGSLLTTANASAGTVFLSEILLPAGAYTASIDYTNKAEEAIENPGFMFEIIDPALITEENTGAINIDANGQFTLIAPTLVQVSLVVPSIFGSDCLIKPQIEKGAVKTSWVPYMKTIGSYVDERFNSTNTKIKVINSQLKELMDIIEIIEE